MPRKNTKLVWKDTTSYSRGEASKGVEPRTWEAQSGPFRILVSRWIHFPGRWLVSCPKLDLELRELDSEKITDAKAEALRLVQDRALVRLKDTQDLIEAVDKALGGK